MLRKIGALYFVIYLLWGTISFVQWGGAENRYMVFTTPIEEYKPMYEQKIEGENKLELISATWGHGSGTKDGIEWQKEGATVVTIINGKKFILTGENGGLDIKGNIVFLIIREVELFLDKEILNRKSPQFFSDSLGVRIRELQRKGVVLPISEFSVRTDGNKVKAEGTLVIALDIFTPNGQSNSFYYAKAFIRNLANWKNIETKNKAGDLAKYETIYQAQKKLKNLGYNPGRIDGIWGKRTQEAVKMFQQDNGLLVTKNLDKKTVKRLGLQDAENQKSFDIHGGRGEEEKIVEKGVKFNFEVIAGTLVLKESADHIVKRLKNAGFNPLIKKRKVSFGERGVSGRLIKTSEKREAYIVVVKEFSNYKDAVLFKKNLEGKGFASIDIIKSTLPLKEATNDGSFYSMEPLIVNLAGGNRYLKVTIELELDKPELTEEITVKYPKIKDTILVLLSSKTFEDVYNAQGKLKVKDEIISHTNSFLRTGRIKDTFFTEFIIQ